MATSSYKLSSTSDVFDSRYELLDSIGRGRNSIVYKARRVENSNITPVAIKLITYTDKKPEEAKRNIQREARALLSLSHPNVIKAYNYVARTDLCYLSLEYAKYGSLSDVLKETRKKPSVKSSLLIIGCILSGLEHIHESGIIHRDLKLENILISGDKQIKIADFGLATFTNETGLQVINNNPIGTLEYIPLECLQGKTFSMQSDIYSVGVILHKLLFNSFPFEAESIKKSIELKEKGEINLAFLGDTLSKFPGLPKFLEKLLSPDLEIRFKSATDAKKALSKIKELPRKIEKTTKDADFVKPNQLTNSPTYRKSNSGHRRTLLATSIASIATGIIFMGIFFKAIIAYYLGIAP